MDQSARTAALDQFRKNEVTLLVASDVAARGLDIPDVSHVFNFDVPHHADDYVHRIGRTGRAGRSGVAITIVTPIDQKLVASIEKLIGQTIPWVDGPPPASDEPARPRSRHERSERSERTGRGRRPERTERPERERRRTDRADAVNAGPTGTCRTGCRPGGAGASGKPPPAAARPSAA